MKLLAIAVLAACGGEPAPLTPPHGGAPALDALIAALQRPSLAALDAIVAEPIGVPLVHRAPLWRMAGAKGHVAGVDATGGVVVWDARTARPLARFQSAIPAPTHIAIAPDGAHLALCGTAELDILDLDTGATHRIDTAPIDECAWLADGRLRAGVATYDAKTFEPIATPDDAPDAAPPPPVAFPPFTPTARGLVDPTTDRPVLALADAVAAWGDQLVTLHDDVATLWTFGGLLIGHSDAIVAIAPRGDRLLTAARDGHAIVWRNGAIEHRLPRAPAALVGAGFVSDRLVATGDANGHAQVYDVGDVREIAHVDVAPDLACLVVQADGRIATATTTGVFETRDAMLEHPAPLATSPCPTGPPVATAGEWRITGDSAGAIRLHPVSLRAAIARACGILRRFDREGDAGAVCR